MNLFTWLLKHKPLCFEHNCLIIAQCYIRYLVKYFLKNVKLVLKTPCIKIYGGGGEVYQGLIFIMVLSCGIG